MSKIKKVYTRYLELSVELKCTIWFLLCSFFQKGISVITAPIFTRILSTSEYGQYSVFNSWMSIVTVFITMNIYSGVYVQGLVKFEEDKYVFTSALQGLVTTMIGIWTIIYLLFQNFWNHLFGLTSVQMLCMLVLIWSTAVFNFWSQEQRVEFKYKKLVIITLFASVLSPFLSVFFIIHADDKVLARILGMVVTDFFIYVWLFYSHIRKGKKFFSVPYWKYAIVFNLPLIPHYLSLTVLNTSDRIMISKMVGDSEAGIYNLAYSIAQIMTIFNTALIKTLEPWLYKKIKSGEVKDIKSVAYPCFILVAFVNIILIAFAPEAVSLFAPKQYQDAIYVIPPIAISGLFSFAYTFFAVFEFYYEKTKQIMLATIVVSLLNIVLNYVGILLWGYIAVGYTTLICYAIFSLFHYISMNVLCKKNFSNDSIYDIRILGSIAVSTLTVGIFFLFSYKIILLRYSAILICMVVLWANRNKIINLLVKIKEA